MPAPLEMQYKTHLFASGSDPGFHGQWPPPGRCRRGRWPWLALVLGLLAWIWCPPTAEAQTREFIVISDLHYNGSQGDDDSGVLFQPGEDASEKLIRLALQDARTHCAGPPLFILCPGDVLAHFNKRRSPQFSPTNEQAVVAGFFQADFPGVPVFTVLGNNDSDTADGSRSDSDYLPQPAAFLQSFAAAWSPLVPAPADTAGFTTNFLDPFATNGWYAVDLPGMEKVRLVGLDSTYFENAELLPPDQRHSPAILDEQHRRATAQFAWLSHELSRAGRDGVTLWLAFHLPPGHDPYDHKPDFWDNQWQTRVLRLIASHHAVIGALFCGHTHADEFRVVYAGTTPVAFAHLAPSISPIHRNNPAYQIFETDTNTGRLLNYRTYHLTSPTNGWTEEYSFTNEYHLPDCGLPSMFQLETNLDLRGNDWPAYTNDYSAGAPGGRDALLDPARYLEDLHITAAP